MKRPQIHYRKVATREQLEQIWSRPVTVRCQYGGDLIEFKSERRLTNAEKRRVGELLEAALPPEAPGSKPDEPRYDFRNPDYVKLKDANQRHARALALYWCFPIFRNKGKPLEAEEEIVRCVEDGKIDDSIKDYAFAMLAEEMVQVDPRRVGFTSGSNSPAN